MFGIDYKKFLKYFSLPLLVVIIFAPSIPNIYQDIRLEERFLFVPWLLFIYTYSICSLYEKVHNRRYPDTGQMKKVKGNYDYTLYWVVFPLILHYYPLVAENADIEKIFSFFGMGGIIQQLFDSRYHEILVNFLQALRFGPALLGDIAVCTAADSNVDEISCGTGYYIYFGGFFLYACYGVYVATRARIYLDGYWGVHLYTYDDSIKKFVDKGPYKQARHPIYAGQIFLVLATAAVALNWAFVVFAALVIFMNTQRALKEQAHLKSIFGEEYLEYKTTTRFYGRFL